MRTSSFFCALSIFILFLTGCSPSTTYFDKVSTDLETEAYQADTSKTLKERLTLMHKAVVTLSNSYSESYTNYKNSSSAMKTLAYSLGLGAMATTMFSPPQDVVKSLALASGATLSGETFVISGRPEAFKNALVSLACVQKAIIILLPVADLDASSDIDNNFISTIENSNLRTVAVNIREAHESMDTAPLKILMTVKEIVEISERNFWGTQNVEESLTNAATLIQTAINRKVETQAMQTNVSSDQKSLIRLKEIIPSLSNESNHGFISNKTNEITAQINNINTSRQKTDIFLPLVNKVSDFEVKLASCIIQ